MKQTFIIIFGWPIYNIYIYVQDITCSCIDMYRYMYYIKCSQRDIQVHFEFIYLSSVFWCFSAIIVDVVHFPLRK